MSKYNRSFSNFKYIWARDFTFPNKIGGIEYFKDLEKRLERLKIERLGEDFIEEGEFKIE